MYEYIFPWWVKSATYQFVNNNNWLPKEGYTFNSSDGYGKIINNYFWYKNSSDTGTSRVVGESYSHTYPAVNIYVNNQVVDTSIVYDYYERNNSYLDSGKTIKYERSIATKDLYLFV